MPSLSVGFTSLLIILLLIPASSPLPQRQQQFAWKPQGRFGKRLEHRQSTSADVTSDLVSQGRLAEKLKNRITSGDTFMLADHPIIHAEEVTCLRTPLEGYYKCFRITAEKNRSGANMFQVMASKNKQKNEIP